MGGKGLKPGADDTYLAYDKPWANASNTPFRMYKHWVHEGGISTPLIVHWPDGIKPKNEFRNQPGHIIDIKATCIDVAGATNPDTFNNNKMTNAIFKNLLVFNILIFDIIFLYGSTYSIALDIKRYSFVFLCLESLSSIIGSAHG